jgi:hypothetical protein
MTLRSTLLTWAVPICSSCRCIPDSALEAERLASCQLLMCAHTARRVTASASTRQPSTRRLRPPPARVEARSTFQPATI